MLTLLKLTYRFNAKPIKIPRGFLEDMEKLIPKLCRSQRIQIFQNNLKRTKEDLTLSDFKIEKPTMNKTMWY